MKVESVLRLAVEVLEKLEIPYMVTGSLASAFYGEPRSTQDLDIVVRAEEGQLQEAGERLRKAGLYCDPGAITEAVSVSGMFNAIDPATGWKIDFIVLKPTAFHRTAFEGRSRSELGGVRLHLIRAEDIVVAKLHWAKLGGSDRQLRDVLGVLMVQGTALDRDEVERWVEELGLRPQWEQVLEWERSTK